jgi:hypothetical protein
MSSPTISPFGSATDPFTQQSDPNTRTGGRSRLIDQIMAHRMQANQNDQLLRLGGSGYMDKLDQLRTDPFAGWF